FDILGQLSGHGFEFFLVDVAHSDFPFRGILNYERLHNLVYRPPFDAALRRYYEHDSNHSAHNPCASIIFICCFLSK
ncbi:MAG: hypothetical protein AB7C96_12620, partial [Hydrogenovibrio sp.]